MKKYQQSGKSRIVSFYNSFVIKESINKNKNYDSYELKSYIVFNSDGIFENLKEILLWEIIKDKLMTAETFANIIDYNFANMAIKAEKLELVSPEIFYKEFYRKFEYLWECNMYTYKYLDNHTIENYRNFGIDNNGNLKILDYPLISVAILDIYGYDLKELTKEKFELLKNEIKKDIENNNFKKFEEIYYSLLPLIIVLKTYNSLIKFLYLSYKYKALKKDEIVKILKKEFARKISENKIYLSFKNKIFNMKAILYRY